MNRHLLDWITTSWEGNSLGQGSTCQLTVEGRRRRHLGETTQGRSGTTRGSDEGPLISLPDLVSVKSDWHSEITCSKRTRKGDRSSSERVSTRHPTPRRWTRRKEREEESVDSVEVAPDSRERRVRRRRGEIRRVRKGGFFRERTD